MDKEDDDDHEKNKTVINKRNLLILERLIKSMKAAAKKNELVHLKRFVT